MGSGEGVVSKELFKVFAECSLSDMINGQIDAAIKEFKGKEDDYILGVDEGGVNQVSQTSRKSAYED